ncbi:hypothetical protein OJF2_52920 [Aquisphaera giovannonii]|uniref:Uncharacterized protein n=1 Tax=Aquisphaera giovannonii TaxID=406548 RepID=A0A5B9W8L2_9BACT|nr:hypothetical protein [Aquisphaera giovannonii]QEH36707.1 hypothetical protein OJF2_52920 [Aquisphaera giovannonii]
MDRDVKNDMIAAWRCLAAFLIYPVTVFPGLHALGLLVSSLCVPLDAWSPEGALSNLLLGLPAIAAIAALWCSVVVPLPVLAGNRRLFVLAASGLMAGLVLEALFLRAGLRGGFGPTFRMTVARVWLFFAPPVVGLVNLYLLIRASLASQGESVADPIEAMATRLSAYPRHHLPESPARAPVVLRPFRPGGPG